MAMILTRLMIETEVCNFWSLESKHAQQQTFFWDEYTKNSVLRISFFWTDTALLDNWIQTFQGNIISAASKVIMSKNAQNIF